MSDAREELARLIAEVTRPLLYRWSNLHLDPEGDLEPTAAFAMRLAREAARVAAGYSKRTPGGEAVEALAQVLAEASGARWDKVGEHADIPDLDWESRDYWRKLARAALAARP